MQFDLIIPAGATPGTSFLASAGGKEFPVVVPAHLGPGDTLRITGPTEAPSAPPPTAPATPSQALHPSNIQDVGKLIPSSKKAITFPAVVGSRKIQLTHSILSGKMAVLVDGVVVHQTKLSNSQDFTHRFTLDGTPVRVRWLHKLGLKYPAYSLWLGGGPDPPTPAAAPTEDELLDYFHASVASAGGVPVAAPAAASADTAPVFKSKEIKEVGRWLPHTKIRVTFTVALLGADHTVRLVHSHVSSKLTLAVDGATIYTGKQSSNADFERHFLLCGLPARVRWNHKTVSRRHAYSLWVEGMVQYQQLMGQTVKHFHGTLADASAWKEAHHHRLFAAGDAPYFYNTATEACVHEMPPELAAARATSSKPETCAEAWRRGQKEGAELHAAAAAQIQTGWKKTKETWKNATPAQKAMVVVGAAVLLGAGADGGALGGGGGDNFWSTGHAAGNFDSSGAGYVNCGGTFVTTGM